MEIITDIDGVRPDKKRKSLITLGKFDGVHVGHRMLFEYLRKEKKTENIIAFTFDIRIRKALDSGAEKSIYDRDEKQRLIEKQGVDILIECPFTDEIRSMEPETFVKEILVKRLNTCLIVIGDDFHFGYKRRGDAALLKKMSSECGYRFVSVDKLKDEGEEISSTLIRELLIKGDIERTNRLLGEPYHITGEVLKGKMLGRKIGFPTANQTIGEEKLTPPYGVYASTVLADGKTYDSITNIGVDPTVGVIGGPVAESHIPGVSLDLYGKEITVYLHKFLRPEKKFGSIDELKKAMAKDIKNAGRI